MKRTIIILFLLFPALAYSNGNPILTIDPGAHTAMVRELIFTSDGSYLISVGDDKVVRVWDVKSGKIAKSIRGEIGKGSEGMLYAATLSPDRNMLAVGGYSATNSIRIHSLRSGEVIRLLKGHTDVILALAFSPDGNLLASGSYDKTVRIWDVASGECKRILKGHTNSVSSVAFSPDGSGLVSASYDKTLRLWDIGRAEQDRAESVSNIVMNNHAKEINCASYSPDGKYIASGSDDNTIGLWDGKNGTFLKTLRKYNGGVFTVSFNPDSTKLVAAGTGDFKALVFSVPSGGLLTTFAKHENVAVASAFHPDGKTVATAGFLGRIYVWDVDTGEVKHCLEGSGRRVWSIAFSQDGRTVAFGNTVAKDWKINNYGPVDKRFDLLDMTFAGDIDMPERTATGGTQNAATTGGTQNAATTGGTESAATEKWRRIPTAWMGMTIEKKGEYELAVKMGEKDVCQIKQALPYDTIHCYGFTPDSHVVVGSAYTLALCDARSGHRIREFVGHAGEVWAIAASPDGRYLASGSSDQTMRLWNIETGELLVSIFFSSDNEWVAWTEKGYFKASAGGDKLIGWQLNQGEDKAAEYYYAYQFRRQFDRPDILENILTAESVDGAIAEANKQRIRPEEAVDIADLATASPPEITIFQPKSGDVVYVSEVKVKAVVRQGSGNPITKVTVLVNGRPIDRQKDITIVESPVKVEVKVDETVSLTPGENIISIVASNQYSTSQPESVKMLYQKPEVTKPNLYLLAIGISSYEDAYRLRYADKDAKNIAEFFSSQEGKLFERVSVNLLCNEEATRGNVLDGLDWILQQTTQKDIAMIFVSGHGTKDLAGNYYFLPSDGNPEKLRRSCVLWAEFENVLASLPSKVVLFMDTCHAGAVTGTQRRYVPDITDILKDLASDELGVVVMASSMGREASVESTRWENGAFTKALLEGLEGKADKNRDGAIYLTEIDAYVTERVKELTGGKQHPTTQKPTTIRSFPVALAN